jgi:methyl-accepting chemotaxis protein
MTAMQDRQEASGVWRPLHSLAGWKVGTKLTVGFGVVVLITAAIGLMAMRSMDTLSGFTINLYEHPFTVTRSLLEARVEIAAVQRDVRDAVVTMDRANVERVAAGIAKSEQMIDDKLMVAKQQFLGDKADFVAAEEAVRNWRPTYHQVLALVRDGKRDEAATLIKTTGAAQVAQLNERMEKVAGFSGEKAAAFMRNAKATSESVNLMTMATVAASLLFGLVVAFVTARSITAPLRGLNDGMLKLASGDFSIVLPGLDRKDEIGAMARAVETFKLKAEQKARDEAEAKIKQDQIAARQRKADMIKLADNFESAVGEIVDTVSSASTELEASAGTLTSTAERAQELTTVVAAASEEASTNVQSVASATEQLTSSVNEISRQVQESARMAHDAVDQAHKTNDRVSALSKAAARIGDVVELINTIAGQTNLLALNATIEAARAGEAGRGFAVVASEVKALAEQTAKATGEIGQQISGIQAATEESVGAIREISGTIEKLSEISATIASAVEEQGAATQEISRNVQQAAQGTMQVSSNITDVQRGASETGSASSQVLSAAQSLSGDSNRLKLEVGKFLNTVRAA